MRFERSHQNKSLKLLTSSSFQEIDEKELSNFPETSLVEELPGPSRDTTNNSDSNHLSESDPSTLSEAPSISENPPVVDAKTQPLPENEPSISVEQTIKENGIEHDLDAAVNDVESVSASVNDADAASEISSIEIVPSIDSCNSEISDSSTTASVEVNISDNLPATSTENAPESIAELNSSSSKTVSSDPTTSTEESFQHILSPENLNIPVPTSQSPPLPQSSPVSGCSDDSEVAEITEVKITLNNDEEAAEVHKVPAKFQSRFNVSPVPRSETIQYSGNPKPCKEVKSAVDDMKNDDAENRDLTISGKYLVS